MKQKRYLTLLVFFCIFFLGVSSIVAKNFVVVDFYYSESCGSCKSKFPIIEAIQENYTDKVIVNWKPFSNATYHKEWSDRGFKKFPAVLIKNETKITGENITYATLSLVIDNYIANLGPGYFSDDNIIYLPFFGKINVSSLSLPVLTITLGALDSFNPCSFFILFFLLSLLIYMQSRRRMLLIGGIFIFFSGFFYFLFMFILFTSISVMQNIFVISIIAGIIAIIIGILNVKDFFFFKQGPSLSIPEKKRPGIFKKMRQLVKTTYLPAVLGGTIFLAVTVNFYELLCTLGFPLVYTSQLAAYNLQPVQYYLYLILYNIIYVIPLIIILMIFVFTLGKTKLSEFQGRQLKLLSGIMIFIFGILFLVDFMLLENVLTPIALLGLSILLTIVISYVWKRYKKEPAAIESDVQESSEDES